MLLFDFDSNRDKKTQVFESKKIENSDCLFVD